MYSDEGLDLSQRISESIFMGPDLEADSEEVIYGECVFGRRRLYLLSLIHIIFRKPLKKKIYNIKDINRV